MKITYSDSIIGFVDVLGFSQLVYELENDNIETYFNYVVNDLKKHFAGTNFEYLLISDSIVISAPNNLDNFKILAKALSIIQAKLLSRGILLRGAIASGALYVNPTYNVVVGPGLIRAYNLESTAVYPRIIIDRALISHYYSSAQAMLDDAEHWLECDAATNLSDKTIYLNYTRYVVRHDAFFNRKRMESILDLLKKNYYSNEHFRKYEWLLNHLVYQLNEIVRESEEASSISTRRRTKLRKIHVILPRFMEMQLPNK